MRAVVAALLASPSTAKFLTPDEPQSVSDAVRGMYEALPYPAAISHRGICDQQRTEGGELNLLSAPTMLRRVADWAWGGTLPSRIRVLDAGCGTGEDTILMTLERKWLRMALLLRCF